jgi:hypothetical protein
MRGAIASIGQDFMSRFRLSLIETHPEGGTPQAIQSSRPRPDRLLSGDPSSPKNRSKRSIKLSIEAYVERLVTEYHLDDAPITHTPLPTSALKLEKRDPN